MCIVCKMREAGASEEALKIANDLAEIALVAANGLARLKAEQGALLNAEEEMALLAAAALFGKEDEPAPDGVPGKVWASAPPQLREIIRATITNGGSVQVVSLSDIIGNQSVTKH